MHDGALFRIGKAADPGVPGVGEGVEVELLVDTLGSAAGREPPELPEPELLDPPELGVLP